MQRWQYMRVQVFVDNGRLMQIRSNGQPVDHSSFDHYTDYLNYVGAVGWQLVSEVYVSDKQHWFHMKRGQAADNSKE